jgi:hypothetical protein
MRNDRFTSDFQSNDFDGSSFTVRPSNSGDRRAGLDFSRLAASSYPVTTGRSLSAGRIRSVGRSPVQEFEARSGHVREIPVALKITLSGGRTKTTIGRNGISFVPKLLNVEGKVKKFTWWNASSPACQPCYIGKTVTAVYDRMNCEVIHVLDDSGKYLDSLPLKNKVPWFDADATQKAMAETKVLTGRVYGQLQNLHVPDSEAALLAAGLNKGRIESIVQTFPVRDRKAPARSSGNAKDMGVAHEAFRGQKAAYERQEAEIQERIETEGRSAAGLLLDEPLSGSEVSPNRSDDAGEAIDLIL